MLGNSEKIPVANIGHIALTTNNQLCVFLE